MCDLIIYLRNGFGDESRDHTDVQSLNLIASIKSNPCHLAKTSKMTKKKTKIIATDFLLHRFLFKATLPENRKTLPLTLTTSESSTEGNQHERKPIITSPCDIVKYLTSSGSGDSTTKREIQLDRLLRNVTRLSFIVVEKEWYMERAITA